MEENRFVSDRLVEHYRRLACAAITGTERMRLLGLMAQEEDRYLVQGDNSAFPGGALEQSVAVR